MKLRGAILLFLLLFGLTPLVMAVAINLPLVLDRVGLFYQKAYLQNLRADFRDLDQHLASRHEMIRLLAKLPPWRNRPAHSDFDYSAGPLDRLLYGLFRFSPSLTRELLARASFDRLESVIPLADKALARLTGK